MDTQADLDRVAKEWLAARRVIRAALIELVPGVRKPTEVADAIIARLASHDPPILLEIQNLDARAVPVSNDP